MRITETPMDPTMALQVRNCAKDCLALLKGKASSADMKGVAAALDAFVFDWQQGRRPPANVITPDDVPYTFGSLWGELIVARFKWQWAGVTFHDHGNSKAIGVFSPDRSMAIYPIHFLIGCLRDPGIDCTIALAYNMMDAGKFPAVPAKGYFNLMDGVHRIVPRI
jgi:hypothetical protein